MATRLQWFAFLGAVLAVTACKKREAETTTEVKPDPSQTAAQRPSPEVWEPPSFAGLDVVVDGGVRVEGRAIEDGLQPTGEQRRAVIPGVLRALDALEAREGLAAQGVLVRVHPAVPYIRLSQILHTVAESGTPATHVAIGDGPAVPITWEIPPQAVFVSVGARGVSITVGTELLPAIDGCPPGPTICFDEPGTFKTRAEEAAREVADQQLTAATEKAGSVRGEVDVDALRQQLSAVTKDAGELTLYKLAAHPWVSGAVLGALLEANCASGDDVVTCERHLPDVALTLLK